MKICFRVQTAISFGVEDTLTKKESYECDSCGAIDSEYPFQNISQCGICGKDFCIYCSEEHAKDETGLTWKK